MDYLQLPKDHVVTVVSTSNTEKLNLVCEQILKEHQGNSRKTAVGFDMRPSPSIWCGASLQLSFPSKSYYIEIERETKQLPDILASLLASDTLLFVGLNIEKDFERLEKAYGLSKSAVSCKDIIHEVKDRGFKLKYYGIYDLCRTFARKAIQKCAPPPTLIVYEGLQRYRSRLDDFDVTSSYVYHQIYKALESITDPRYQPRLKREDLPHIPKLLLFNADKTAIIASATLVDHQGPRYGRYRLDGKSVQRIVVRINEVYDHLNSSLLYYATWHQRRKYYWSLEMHYDPPLWDLDLVIPYSKEALDWHFKHEDPAVKADREEGMEDWVDTADREEEGTAKE
ncbi:hypothetical protein HDV05_000171 [Chytridiales sp. JEL 0842]|nr:hypothetical protein HDV05_000171 [Chytridiales sp. JEL 0842]